MLKSTSDFIDLLQSKNNQGIIASLDVESLFTNVPIDDTIDIIIQHVYHHPTLQPPKLNPNHLRSLLEICTRECPFNCPQGKLYAQVNGVAMGQCLGSTFANFYMAHHENLILNEHFGPEINIYCRYVDDIFIQVEDEGVIHRLKSIFEQKTVLKFTFELNLNNRLPFLDVMVNNTPPSFHTTVY